MLNTVEEKRHAISDSRAIRVAALNASLPLYTTLWGAEAAVAGLHDQVQLEIHALQDLHQML